MFDTTKLPEEIKIGSTLDDKKLMHLFTHFLKSNNCYKEYRANQTVGSSIDSHKRSYFYNYKVKEHYFIYYSQNGLAAELINFAFNWSKTKQGHYYWGDLNFRWKRLLEKYKLELKNFF